VRHPVRAYAFILLTLQIYQRAVTNLRIKIVDTYRIIHIIPGQVQASACEAMKETDTFSLLKSIAEASTVFLALAFVAGWSYLSSYYKTFGLSPTELDIPLPVVATVAVHMLYDSIWPLPVLGLLVAALVALSHRFVSWRSKQGWVVAGVLLILFCSTIAALFRGRDMANFDMLEETPNLPLIAFASKSESAKLGPPDQPSCVAFQTFGTMDCKLLIHSKSTYYFFRPIPQSLASNTDKLDLYMIPDAEVLAMHLQRGIDLSGMKR
jgi:hypothetical protein